MSRARLSLPNSVRMSALSQLSSPLTSSARDFRHSSGDINLQKGSKVSFADDSFEEVAENDGNQSQAAGSYNKQSSGPKSEENVYSPRYSDSSIMKSIDSVFNRSTDDVFEDDENPWLTPEEICAFSPCFLDTKENVFRKLSRVSEVSSCHPISRRESRHEPSAYDDYMYQKKLNSDIHAAVFNFPIDKDCSVHDQSAKPLKESHHQSNNHCFPSHNNSFATNNFYIEENGPNHDVPISNSAFKKLCRQEHVMLSRSFSCEDMKVVEPLLENLEIEDHKSTGVDTNGIQNNTKVGKIFIDGQEKDPTIDFDTQASDISEKKESMSKESLNGDISKKQSISSKIKAHDISIVIDIDSDNKILEIRPLTPQTRQLMISRSVSDYSINSSDSCRTPELRSKEPQRSKSFFRRLPSVECLDFPPTLLRSTSERSIHKSPAVSGKTHYFYAPFERRWSAKLRQIATNV